MKNLRNKKLVLIDGHSQAYRSFYALPSLTNSKGQPTNAVYGFLTTIFKIIKEQEPDYLAVSFDLAGPTFRKKKFEAYKAHRKPMPDELVSQIPLLRKCLQAMGIPIFEKEGFEADDCMATLAKKAESEGLEVLIATGDKDILQLVDEKIKVLRVHKSELSIYDKDKVKEQYGVGPEGIADLLGLMGDASDNIPGVKGVGEKTAAGLMEQFGSLDKIYGHLDKVKSDKMRENLQAQEESARMSRDLARLDLAVPLEIKWDDCKVGAYNTPEFYNFLKEMEFKRLLSEFTPPAPATPEGMAMASSVFETFTQAKEIQALVKEMKKQKALSLALLQGEGHPLEAPLLGLTFCFGPQSTYFIPAGPVLEKTLPDLKTILEDEAICKVGHNLKSKQLGLFSLGVVLKGLCFDTMLAGHLLDEQQAPGRELGGLTLAYLSEVLEKSEPSPQSAATEALSVWKLVPLMKEKLKDKRLEELYLTLEMPLLKVLARMEQRGVAVDRMVLKKISIELERELERLTGEIYGLAGETFNINSTQQLAKILFEKLKLPTVRKTKTGYSTDVEVLEELSDKHPLPAKLLDYRQYNKLKNTYVDALPELVLKSTGRIHPVFHQNGTATGRLSCSDPNLQNIPIRTDWGVKIREAFVAGKKDQTLLSADYSQIELRVLAHLSQDQGLMEAFQKGVDIHTQTGQRIFGVKEVSKDMRRKAKVVNFGVIYGMSPFGLAKELEIPVGQAQDYIEGYFRTYPRVREYFNGVILQAQKSGYVSTQGGRKRYLPDLLSQNKNKRDLAERMAFNTPIQGTAAELIKKAMLDIEAKTDKDKLPLSMILQVHDELVFEVPKTQAEEMAKVVKSIMEKAMPLSVPVEVEVKSGANWRLAH